jgi:4-amino-4-deoxy-L-arabinose transferase-like glycosyltransferase
MAKTKKTKLILITILLLASFLRLWRLSKVPVSLFGDELDVGYHAYSILKTGKDYSGNSWPLHFQSLAEWRTPLYLYSAVPTVAIFGITPLGVRLPAAIFGILGIWALYLLVKELTKKEILALISALVLAFSPWHIQYSRAAFEVTQLLAFLLFGLYFFFKSLPTSPAGRKDGHWLWISMALLAFTPWIYSTAKLFTPLLLMFLFLVYKKELFSLAKKNLIWAILVLIVVGGPIAYSTLFGGGAQRFSYISVFTDPTREAEVGVARELDARMRGKISEGLQPTFTDKLFHNKFIFWGSKVLNNYFESFSTDFLFTKGDINLRHSIEGMGQFYKIEAVALILGLIFFFTSRQSLKTKLLIAFWILVGVLPAAITRDGGKHATRLILILPPLIFLISYGLMNLKKLPLLVYCGIWVLSFIFYQHNYWVHNPWYSERWWHAGFGEAIHSIKAIEGDYDRVVISMAGEPAWIFFAGHYQYPPEKWHKEFPIGNDVELPGFGKISHIDKFYFGMPEAKGLYSWGQVIDNKTLYLATAKEVGVNLIMEPERTPKDLKLIKAVPYPSGEPAYYLFSGRGE